MSRFAVVIIPKVADGPPTPSHLFHLDPPADSESYEVAWAVCEGRQRLGLVPGTVHEIKYEDFADRVGVPGEGIYNHDLRDGRMLTVCDMHTEGGRDLADFLGVDTPSA